jgi:allantoinase
VFLPDLVIRSQRVIVGESTRPAALHVRRGKIIGVLDFDDVPAGCPLDDAGDRIVMPGLVDTQVHIGRDFETVTRAAAAGGVTTIIGTPLERDSPATDVRALEEQTRAAAGRCFVDVGFWGGVVPGNTADLPSLAEAGVHGFTCSLASPVVETYPSASEADLRAAMPVITQLGRPLLVHAELTRSADVPAHAPRSAFGRILARARAARSGRRYDTYLTSKPKDDENRAVALLIQLCHEYRTRTHIVQLSSSDALTPIFQARSASLSLSAGTCPHYLHFVAEEIPDGATEFTCAPPIRERKNRELLWAALAGGLVQMIASDHWPSPAPAGSKAGNFLAPRTGIYSLPFSLSAMWTSACARQHSAARLANWMCRAPARLAGLDRKGAIEVGNDADLAIWDPDAELTVDAPSTFAGSCGTQSRGGGTVDCRRPETPYANRRLRGVVERTYLGGACVYERGKPMPSPRGRLLARERASANAGAAAIRSAAARPLMLFRKA